MGLKQNTWTLNNWYDQDVAGNVSYDGLSSAFSSGDNTYGQLGQNQGPAQLARVSSPVQVPGTTWELGNYGACEAFYVKRTDGTLWGLGRNQYGQLGQNSTIGDYLSSPVQIDGTTWDFVSAMAGGGVKATKTDGTLWSWGATYWGEGANNTPGSLGPGTKYKISSPTQIPGTTWATGENKHTGSGNSSYAIKTDGSLWAWGYNGYGQLGLNNKTAYSSPVQIGTETTWNTVVLGNNQEGGGGIKTDGTLWLWGRNNNGQLGVGSPTNVVRSSPIQVPGTTWEFAVFGEYSVYAQKTDGTLWVWGANAEGQLGQNNKTQYDSPVQVPGTDWSILASNNGEKAIVTTKTDGTLWGWGSGNKGNLGLNSLTQYSSPVQIGSLTTWTQISPSANTFWGKTVT